MLDGLAEREADRLELAHEPDPLDGAGLVVAVARLGARGLRQDADPLVEAHRVDRDARLARDLADLHPLHP